MEEREKNHGYLKASSLDLWKNEDSLIEIRNSGEEKAGFQETGKDFHFQHGEFEVLPSKQLRTPNHILPAPGPLS